MNGIDYLRSPCDGSHRYIGPYPSAYAACNFHSYVLRRGLNFLGVANKGQVMSLPYAAFVYATKKMDGLSLTEPQNDSVCLTCRDRQTWSTRLESNQRVFVLQTNALPLGYSCDLGARRGSRTLTPKGVARFKCAAYAIPPHAQTFLDCVHTPNRIACISGTPSSRDRHTAYNCVR